MGLKRKTKNKINYIYLVGLLLILVGSIMLFTQIYNSYQQTCVKQKSIDIYLEKQDLNNNNENIKSTKKEENIINYIAVLEIPQIKLKQGLVSIDDKNNIVDKNIEILKESDMPNVKNGIFILASHSGRGATAYFTKLDKLDLEDKIYIYYEGKKYIYQVNETYIAKKTGNINIKRNSNETELALITCSNNNNEEQLVVISNLIEKQDY